MMIPKGDPRLGFDPEFFNHLEYGKLYVFAANEQQAEGYRDSKSHPKLCRWSTNWAW